MKKIAIDINNTLRDNLTQIVNCYKKLIDNKADIKREDIDSFEFMNCLSFESREAYNRFIYEDCAFEIFGKAEPMDKVLPYRFNDWVQNTLRDFEDTSLIPEVMLFSPLEIGMTIQATYYFLAKISCRVREVYFPVNSATIWDRSDIVVTANPNLLENIPEGKIGIKIVTPYNKDIECKYVFESMLELIQDKEETMIKLIKDETIDI